MNTTITNAIEAINAIETQEDMNTVIEALKDRQRALAAAAKFEFSPGDRVTFEARNGRTVTGTVTKRLKVNVQVQQDDGPTWRVTPSLLTKVVDA